MNKKLRSLIGMILAFALVIPCALPVTVSAKGKVRLNKTKVNLTVGKTVKLKLKNNKKKVKWSSSNKQVAAVNKKGRVKAKKKGKATITAKAGKKKYQCKVTVKAKDNTSESGTATLSPTAKPTGTPGFTSRPSASPTNAPGATSTVSPTGIPGFTYEPSANPTALPGATSTISPSGTGIDASQYSYSITPLTDDICYYFYVKTDNPDPTSFDFIDEDTTMSDSSTGRISMCRTEFADVEYVDPETLRVKDGYIFYGGNTDGGEITLEAKRDGEFTKTEQILTLPELKSMTKYLIDEYTTDSMSFFEKMDAVQSGLDSICLYSGVYVLGELQKSTTSPYYGLSTSPHIDQDFYIQDPYYRTDSRSMLVSVLYPYRLDSLGFPSEMGAVAKTLEPSASYQWNSYAHWLVDVTYNGETRSYGGAGNGGGQGITENLIKYVYSFDGSADDAFVMDSWDDIRGMIEEYGSMTVVEEGKDLPELTWKDVCDIVGTGGSYVKLVLITSIFGGTSEGYTFLYSDGYSSYPEFFSDVWYDGRYFNAYEFFQKGVTFDDAPTADIIIKDAVIPFPEDSEGKEYSYNSGSIDKVSNYNADTGVWSGFMTYYYDEDSHTWISPVYNRSRCYDVAEGKYSLIDEEDFKDACILTPEEVKAMGVDAYTNVDPESYYNYDMTVPPGTKVN